MVAATAAKTSLGQTNRGVAATSVPTYLPTTSYIQSLILAWLPDLPIRDLPFRYKPCFAGESAVLIKKKKVFDLNNRAEVET